MARLRVGVQRQDELAGGGDGGQAEAHAAHEGVLRVPQAVAGGCAGRVGGTRARCLVALCGAALQLMRRGNPAVLSEPQLCRNAVSIRSRDSPKGDARLGNPAGVWLQSCYHKDRMMGVAFAEYFVDKNAIRNPKVAEDILK